MTLDKFLKFFFQLVLVTSAVPCFAQFQVADSSTGKKLEIIAADRYNFQKIEGKGDFISLAGKVKIRQEETLFYCDSAVLNQSENIVEAFGNIHINDADSIHTYSQYLKYLGKEKIAFLNRNVRLTDRKAVLTTNNLTYNTATHAGTYLNGGKLVNGKTVLTSTEGYYYGETKDVYFKKKVVLNDPEYKITTDTLWYNTLSEIATFTVPTKIVTSSRTIKTSDGYYDMRNKKAVLGERPVVDDKDYTLTANDMAFDDVAGFGEAQGNVVYKTKDTANPVAILANNMKANQRTESVMATQHPLMIIQQNSDTIYVTADTLFTGKITELEKYRNVPNISVFEVQGAGTGNNVFEVNDTIGSLDSKISLTPAASRNVAFNKLPVTVTKDSTGKSNSIDSSRQNSSRGTNRTVNRADTKKIDSSLANQEKADSSNNRYFEAYFNVKVFSDSMQAVSDSLFYSFRDSAFRLFKKPIVWSQENQITGDTIYLFTQNKKPHLFYAYENALAINKAEKNLYNQIKGNTMTGIFKAGEIDFFKAKGAAENIYYTTDDEGAFIGVNRSTADVIDVTFKDRKPYKVVFRNNLQGTLSPIKQVKTSDLKVRGFTWYDDKRPKTKYELF